MLYYLQVLDLIFLSTCFLSINIGFVFRLERIDRRPHWSELTHLSFQVKNNIICRQFHSEAEVQIQNLC